MAKRRTKRRDDDDDAGEAPPPMGGADSTTGRSRGAVEKEPSMVSDEKGVRDDEPAEEDVVISAPIHCDGCARKLRRSLQRLDGVREVSVDSRTNTVVVSGPGAVENAAEAVEIAERKTGKKTMLLNPSPAVKKGAGRRMKESDDTPGDAIADVDTDMVIVLRINLHCDACCEEIKRRILKIQGVKDAAPRLKSSQLVVKGTVEPATLVGFIHRSTGRKAAITRAEPLLDHHPLPTARSPPIMHDEAGQKIKHQDPYVVVNNNSGEKKNGHDDGHEMDDDRTPPPQQQEEENNINGGNEKLRRQTEKPSDGDLGVEGHGTGHHDGDDAATKNGFLVKNHKKQDDHLFRAPLPTNTGVVMAVAPEMNNLNPYYYYSYPSSAYYPYAHQHHQQYNYQQSYPYAYSSPAPAAMCGSSTHGSPPEAFSEENPNACTLV